MFIDKESFLKVSGRFTLCSGYNFFVETEVGNFHYKDSHHGGDNTLTVYNGTYDQFCSKVGSAGTSHPFKTTIETFCGPDFTLVISDNI